MGKEVTGIQHRAAIFGPTVGSTHEKFNVTPKPKEERNDSSDYEVKECTEENPIVKKHNDKQDETTPESNEKKQDVLAVKSTNHEEKTTEKSEAQKLISNEKNMSLPETKPAQRRKDDDNVGTETAAIADVNDTPLADDSKKNSQPNTPPATTKPDEEDHSSADSSTAASELTLKPITVGVAPKFRSDERIEKRKEYYQKLEEKRRAMEAERSQYEARANEEAEAALKKLRKNLVIKAKPVPSFYHEAPPPKAELKKPPLTRPKSPNLTRRKSFGDVISSPQAEKKGAAACARARRSLGSQKLYSTTTPTAKCRSIRRNVTVKDHEVREDQVDSNAVHT